MIARFGSVEIGCVANCHSISKLPKSMLYYIQGKTAPWWWESDVMMQMRFNAGFFSSSPNTLKKFSDLMLQDMLLVDILASWRFEENYFKEELSRAYKIHLELYNPFWADVPWTRALEGKKVLVVHPFSETIEKQYAKRELLHKNKYILPTFQLTTIKAVQSIGGECSEGFNDWFSALEFMKSEIDKTDYDICLIGCGAYGFPLAAHVKRMNKQAVHMGGSLQLLFGIRGRRWENYSEQHDYTKFMNDYWVRPSIKEVPSKALQIEGGCYW